MSDRTSIEWADASWNPVTGCTKVSQGCKHCYAERLAPLLKARHNPSYENGFEVTVHERMLPLPTTWKKAQEHIRQLHVGPIPRAGAHGVHHPGVRCDHVPAPSTRS